MSKNLIFCFLLEVVDNSLPKHTVILFFKYHLMMIKQYHHQSHTPTHIGSNYRSIGIGVKQTDKCSSENSGAYNTALH